jgi:zinc transporter, ZIP family
MPSSHLVVLGAIAGLTIFLGLPMGRVRARMASTRTVLNAVAIGVLVFLLWDILAHGWEPVDEAIATHDTAAALGYGVLLVGGIAVGLLGLVWFDQWVARRTQALPTPAPAPAVSAGPTDSRSLSWRDLWALPAGRLAVLIAVGIGLHNFAEGLAIGGSAASGELALAWLLVIGFATHNATEGFGIVAPLAAARIRPTWSQLLVLGLIGGGPTIVGTLTGSATTSPAAGVAFLALAAGSILYVIIELLAVARRFALKYHTSWGLIAGLALGFVTDAILTAGGA